MDVSTLEENIERLKAEVKTIADRAGRNDKIYIVGACKTMPKKLTDRIAEKGLLDALGDNRVQEFLDKYEPGIEWHFIGNLQTNKVKYIVDKVTLIHSLDRHALAAEIDKKSAKIGKRTRCLIEVNVGCEESKGGVMPEEFNSFADSLADYANIEVCGVMSVLPKGSSEEEISGYMEKLKEFFAYLESKYGDEVRYISAGMTEDYAAAIRYGSNMIRIGRSIFGERS